MHEAMQASDVRFVTSDTISMYLGIDATSIECVTKKYDGIRSVDMEIWPLE